MTSHSPSQSLRAKIVWLAVGLFLAALLVALVGFAGMRRVIHEANRIPQECVPILQSAHLARQALQDSARARDQALLDVTRPEDAEQLRFFEGRFQRADIEFDMYMKALIWGCDSRVFSELAGGLTYAEWRRHGLEGQLIVGQAPPRIRQLASQADLYQAGYSNRARQALKSQRRALRLQLADRNEEAQQAWQAARQARTQSAEYAELVRDVFGEMDRAVSAYVRRTVEEIADTQQDTQAAALGLSLVLLVVIIALCRILAVRMIVQPLQRLMDGVAAVSRGDWTVQLPPASRDELGQLTDAFNTMAAQLVVLLQRERLLASTVEAADAAQQRVDQLERESESLRDANERLRQLNEKLREDIARHRQAAADRLREGSD